MRYYGHSKNHYIYINDLIMRALEFKSKIENNRIEIPAGIQSQLKNSDDKNVRVIVLIDDLGYRDDSSFQQTIQTEFLKGYSDSDAVYDNF